MKANSMGITVSNPRKRVALLVYTSFEPGRETLRGIAKFAHEFDNWRLFYVPKGDHISISEWLLDSGAEGIIARVGDDAMAQTLRATGLPVVDVNRSVLDIGIPQIDADDEGIAALVAGHFFDHGFKHIGFYPHESGDQGWSQRRCKSMREECVERATFHIFEPPVDQPPGSKAARHAVRAWIRALPKPVGIMVSRDDGGLMVLDACREENMIVPEQVAVVGVDNDRPLCDLSAPPLSSVRLDHHKIGYEAAHLLDRLMASSKPPSDPLLIPPIRLVTRRSSNTRAIIDPAVALGVHFIYENLSDSKLGNDDLAREAGISRSLFQRRFRKETGMTIRNFLIEVRLAKAKSLLRDSNLSLSEISEIVGFCRQSYLGHVFKKYLGITPRSFRAEQS
ncbi:MAG: LacI family transcriptional regulator [Akkermansiaceae bacterium]|jgi:LacI family transcriptional regulator